MPEFSIVESERYIIAQESRLRCCLSMSEPAPSGRRERVLIACVLDDVPMVVEPALFYKAEVLHLLHPADDPEDAMGPVHQEMYDEVRSRLDGDAEIIDHEVPAHDYKALLRILLTIVREEAQEDSEVYVNISSGTPEYAAAAMLVCMQNRGFTAFTVRTKEYSVTPGEFRELAYEDGKPVGYSREVFDPVKVVTFDPAKQDSDLITCLGVFADLRKTKKRVYFEEIIDRLREEGVWTYVPDSRRRKTDALQKTRMQFVRSYITPLVKKGWIKEDEISKRVYHITPEGDAIINVYYGIDKE